LRRRRKWSALWTLCAGALKQGLARRGSGRLMPVAARKGRRRNAARRADGAHGLSKKTRFFRNGRAERQEGKLRQRRELGTPETCGAAAPLRSAPGDGWRPEELGRHKRTEPRTGRETTCRPCRGSSARLRRLRGNDPQGRVWRRHGDRVGSR